MLIDIKYQNGLFDEAKSFYVKFLQTITKLYE